MLYRRADILCHLSSLHEMGRAYVGGNCGGYRYCLQYRKPQFKSHLCFGCYEKYSCKMGLRRPEFVSSSTGRAVLVITTHVGNVLFCLHSPDVMITVLWQAISLQNIPVSVLLKTFHSAESNQNSFCYKQNLVISDASVANGYVIE